MEVDPVELFLVGDASGNQRQTEASVNEAGRQKSNKSSDGIHARLLEKFELTY